MKKKISSPVNFFLFTQVILVACYLFIHNWTVFDATVFSRGIRSIISLLTILVFPAINLAWIIQGFMRTRRFSSWELLNISAVASLTILPLLIAIEIVAFRQIYPWLPILNSILIGLVCYVYRPAISLPKTTVSLPLIIILCTYAITIVAVVSSYYTLPDSDPYYWYRKYSTFIQNSGGPFSLSSRPLYNALIYLLNQGASIDLYATFKYLLPSLFVLTIIPTALLAETFKRKTAQMAVFMVPFFSASTILYSLIQMPQAIIIILTTFFTLWILYAQRKSDSFFYYAAGICIALATLYHETATLLFLPWLLITLLTDYKKLLQKAQRNPIATVLAILLLATNINVISPSIQLIRTWGIYIQQKDLINPNWLFPAVYMNVDNNAVGWNSMIGVVQYYSFYAGPPAFVILALFLIFISRIWRLNKFSFTRITSNRSLLVLLSIFLLFFSIAEILPRSSSIALLPDRAWIFAGLTSFVFLYIMLTSVRLNKITFSICAIIIMLSYVNIGTALYINSLKRHVIPAYQLKSAKWIKRHLPLRRMVLSTNRDILIKFYSFSPYTDIQGSILCTNNTSDKQSIQEYVLGLEPYSKSVSSLNSATATISDSLQQYAKENQSQDTRATLLNLQSELDKLAQEKANTNLNEKQNYYIYYAQEDSRNPYYNRPYFSAQQAKCDYENFEKYPDLFQEVYRDDNLVRIWKINIE